MKLQIHATLGPASWQGRNLEKLLDSPISAVRINMSHMDQEKLPVLFERIRSLAPHIALGADIRGRKLRIGTLPGGSLTLSKGDRFILIPVEGEDRGSKNSATVNYPAMAEVMKPKDKIILDDGALRLVVEKTTAHEVICHVTRGGILTDRCGVNTPNRQLNLPGLTSKDYTDLDFLSTIPLDLIYFSFAEKAEDIQLLRAALKQRNMNQPITAKIETRVAVDNFEELSAVSDALCMARGDMGVEIPMEELPYVQRSIIASAKRGEKTLLLAGEVLYSLIHRHEPFRAELMDIVTAVEQGVSGFILSDETAIGVDPVNAVQVLSTLITEAGKRKDS